MLFLDIESYRLSQNPPENKGLGRSTSLTTCRGLDEIMQEGEEMLGIFMDMYSFILILKHLKEPKN